MSAPIPSDCYAWQYGPETPEYITTCAGCGLGMTERDPSYPTARGLIHADLTCAVMALNNGDEPPCGPAGEYLRVMAGCDPDILSSGIQNIDMTLFRDRGDD